MGYEQWAVDMFAGQFQPDGDGFIYRKNMKGAAIRVTAAERERYIAAYKKSFRYSVWGGAGAVILFVFGAIFFFDNGGETSGAVTGTVFLLLMVFYLLASYWAMSAPARELRGRPTLGEPATRTEVRNAFLRSMSYRQMATVAVMLSLLMFSKGPWQKLSSEWKVVAWAGIGVLLAALVFRAYQKWQLERGDGA